MSNNELAQIQPIPAPKRVLDVLNGGANRGARENIRAFEAFNNRTSHAQLQLTYADPDPGRAEGILDDPRLQRMLARAFEGKVEDLVRVQNAENEGPIVLNLDRASGIAAVLRETEGSNRPILAYLLLDLPSGSLWGWRLVLEPRDRAARMVAITVFDVIAAASERNGSTKVLGTDADPAHRLIEPIIRSWFAEHCEQNLHKIAAGVEPVTATMEVTDGQTTYPLFVAIRDDWSDPLLLAEQIVANPTMPIRKGTQFVVAEVSTANAGIRFHIVRRRTDDRVTVAGSERYDAASIEANREVLRQRALEAIEHAKQVTISRRNPVRTTD